MTLHTAMKPIGGPSSLVFAAADRKHRPPSHPVLRGLPRFNTEPVAWTVTPQAIRQRRLARGWSQYRLAAVMGVSRPAVAQWESGAYLPSPEHVARLREVLS